MAHFYGSMNGVGDGEVTKTGTKNSGMDAHLRGWRVGVSVTVRHIAGKDVITVFRTRGSNGDAMGGERVQIAEASE